MRHLHVSVFPYSDPSMSADEQHCPETLETLKFAGRCSQVETKAQKNIVSAVAAAADISYCRLTER